MMGPFPFVSCWSCSEQGALFLACMVSFKFGGRELRLAVLHSLNVMLAGPCMPLQVALFAWCFQLLAAYVDSAPVLSFLLMVEHFPPVSIMGELFSNSRAGGSSVLEKALG